MSLLERRRLAEAAHCVLRDEGYVVLERLLPLELVEPLEELYKYLLAESPNGQMQQQPLRAGPGINIQTARKTSNGHILTSIAPIWTKKHRIHRSDGIYVWKELSTPLGLKKKMVSIFFCETLFEYLSLPTV